MSTTPSQQATRETPWGPSIKPLQELLRHLTASTYRLDIPNDFLAQFFADRGTITDITKDYFISRKKAASETIDNVMLYDGTELFGQSTIEENFALHSIIHLLKPREILEVGIFRGQTAVTLNRALQQAGQGNYTGIDISADTVEIVQRILKSEGLLERAKVQLADSTKVIDDLARVEFAFIDGDHNWEVVVRDVVGVYNKLPAGGVIAMHDTGTRAWGWFMQDPGTLFHCTLMDFVVGHAELYWLDSMCRELTMQLLSPSAAGEHRYFTTLAESIEKARVTTFDTVRGWGGIGFILKVDGSHRLDLEALLAQRPSDPDLKAPSTSKTSMLGRIARKVARTIP